jgi:rhodanese-related sulfurtransferase
MDTSPSIASAQPTPNSIRCASLAQSLGGRHAPLILDVRREPAFEASPRVIASALRWSNSGSRDSSEGLSALRRERPVVVYCVHGHEVSQGAALELDRQGFAASYLEGGISEWEAQGLPMVSKHAELALPAQAGRATRWITRERPKIDRIACPWLVRRFIDPQAQFIYVPGSQVLVEAKALGAIPYDVPKVLVSHRGADGEECSFDTLLAETGLSDPALLQLARIVRGADTGKPELTPQSHGLLAISLGLSLNFKDDHEMLEQGMTVYDALYAWIKSARDEVHNAVLFRQS